MVDRVVWHARFAILFLGFYQGENQTSFPMAVSNNNVYSKIRVTKADTQFNFYKLFDPIC